MKRLAWFLSVPILLAALGAAAVFSWYRGALEPAAVEAVPIDFEVARGASLKSVAAQLAGRGVIRDARAFEWLARSREEAGKLQVGEYEVSAAQRAEEILAMLVEGRVKTYEVGIPEGLTAHEVVDRFTAAGLAERDALLAAIEAPGAAARYGVEGPGLEGYLFPETYRFPRGVPAEEIVRVLTQHFLAVWEEIDEAAAERQLGMRQVVTLASIVEKETGVASERPRVASVFVNRLRRGMRLQSDPTVIYGLTEGKEVLERGLRRSELDRATPYNTYVIDGLPPTPIASPGRDAIMAVVNPEETDFLYFVADGTGGHVFAKTLAEHNRNVAEWRKIEKKNKP